MNKIGLVLMAAIVALTISTGRVNAQDGPVTVGVKAGVNLSTLDGDVKHTKSVFKYQFGITADIALSNNLYVMTGLDLQTKGTKSKSDIKYNPMYIQLPAHLGYKFSLSPSVKFVVNAGPYVAYGIGGKVKGDGNNEKIFGNNKFKKLDYGVGGGIGFEISKLCINGGYDFGLNDISDMKDVKVKNRNAYVTLGYKF